MYPQPHHQSGSLYLPHIAARAASKSNGTRPIGLKGWIDQNRHSWYSNTTLSGMASEFVPVLSRFRYVLSSTLTFLCLLIGISLLRIVHVSTKSLVHGPICTL